MKRQLTRMFFGVLLGASAQPALSQVGNYGLIYQGAYNNALFLTTKNSIERSMHLAEGKAGNSNNKSNTNTANNSLTYTPSAAVHDKVSQSIAKMAAGNNGFDEAAVKNAGLLAAFDRLLRQYNFNSHNLADVYAAYIILSWQAVTGGDATQSPKGIEIFRQKVHTMMNEDPAIAKLSAAQKQETTETLSYLAIIASLTNDAIKKNNPKNASLSRESIRQSVLKLTGMDLGKYRLTQSGLFTTD